RRGPAAWPSAPGLWARRRLSGRKNDWRPPVRRNPRRAAFWSCEQAVDEPPRFVRFAIKALAEQPEAAALAVLDPVVVAGLLVRRAPPFAADPLGSLRTDHFVEHAAPAEPQGRTVGHLGQGLDRLGRVE